jgi:hypothetical protein
MRGSHCFRSLQRVTSSIGTLNFGSTRNLGFLPKAGEGSERCCFKLGWLEVLWNDTSTSELKAGVSLLQKQGLSNLEDVWMHTKQLFYDIYYNQIVSTAKVSIQKEKEEGSELDPIADSLTRENFAWLIRSAKFFGTPMAERQLRVRVIHAAKKLNGQKSPLPDNCEI